MLPRRQAPIDYRLSNYLAESVLELLTPLSFAQFVILG
jgi:hypothetical protein